MNRNVFAKNYGFGTFRETLLDTLDFTLDQLEFADDEKILERARLEKIMAEFEQKIIDKFVTKFTDEEIDQIAKYLTQETPGYMNKFAKIHAELNEEFGNQILDSLEKEEEE